VTYVGDLKQRIEAMSQNTATPDGPAPTPAAADEPPDAPVEPLQKSA
jgi:hypothetical protein